MDKHIGAIQNKCNEHFIARQIYIYIYIYIYIRTLKPSCGKAHWYKYREVGSLTSGQLRSGQFRPSCRQITLWADNVHSVFYLPTTRLDRLYIQMTHKIPYILPYIQHTIQVYSVTTMTHVIAFDAGQSIQGTFEPVTPAHHRRL